MLDINTNNIYMGNIGVLSHFYQNKIQFVMLSVSKKQLLLWSNEQLTDR